MSHFTQLQTRLQAEPQTWLVTGSNLLEALLMLNQRVVGLDNFATGHQRNLDEVQSLVTPAQWENFNFIQGGIRNLDDCRTAIIFTPSWYGDSSLRVQCGNPPPVDYVLHQAAIGSVPRSIEDPTLPTKPTSAASATCWSPRAMPK